MLNVGPGELIALFALSVGLCGVIARHKGLTARYFVALGIVLPLIGVIVALAWPRREHAVA